MSYCLIRRPTLPEDEGRHFLIGTRDSLIGITELLHEKIAEGYWKFHDFDIQQTTNDGPSDVRKFASYIRQRFIVERISRKTGWGKNEIEQAWNESLLEAMLDLKENLPLAEIKKDR